MTGRGINDAINEKLLDEFPEEITKTAPTPATENLFKVRDEKDASPLSGKQSAQFHRIMAQLLFASGIVRCYFQPVVYFFTMRVKTLD